MEKLNENHGQREKNVFHQKNSSTFQNAKNAVNLIISRHICLLSCSTYRKAQDLSEFFYFQELFARNLIK
jgi:hypothetical protein